MNDLQNFNAVMAWTAFGAQDYAGLEQYGGEIYNYFVHNPADLLKFDSSLFLIGKVFQVCLGFQEPDEDIQEVRAENAFLCFFQALKSDKANVHDEASARLMMLLIRDQKHLKYKVEQACKNECANTYDIFCMQNNGLPKDMPLATNTKMLYASYYLYDRIIDKRNVYDEFVHAGERIACENVIKHVIANCSQLPRISSDRIIELGGIVFEKIFEKLKNDIILYSSHL